MKLTLTNVSKNPAVPVSTPLGVLVVGTPLSGTYTTNQLEKMSADLEYLRVAGYITYAVTNDAAQADALEAAVQTEQLNLFSLTVGAEGAVAANTIEIAVQLTDPFGTALLTSKEVSVRALAVTNAQGTVAAAGTPVGTLVKANNAATGECVGWFTTTAAGLFSVRIGDTAAESVLVVFVADGFQPKTVKLTFA